MFFVSDFAPGNKETEDKTVVEEEEKEDTQASDVSFCVFG